MAAIENEDWDATAEALKEVLLHIPFYAWIVNDDVWDDDELHSLCHLIGEAIYQKAGFSAMQTVWYIVNDALAENGSKPLERYWDGCGNGAWRA